MRWRLAFTRFTQPILHQPVMCDESIRTESNMRDRANKLDSSEKLSLAFVVRSVFGDIARGSMAFDSVNSPSISVCLANGTHTRMEIKLKWRYVPSFTRTRASSQTSRFCNLPFLLDRCWRFCSRVSHSFSIEQARSFPSPPPFDNHHNYVNGVHNCLYKCVDADTKRNGFGHKLRCCGACFASAHNGTIQSMWKSRFWSIHIDATIQGESVRCAESERLPFGMHKNSL